METFAPGAIRITGGNFRLLNRLLTQVERILEINALPTVTKEVVEAHARILSSGSPRKLYDAPSAAIYPLAPRLQRPAQDAESAGESIQ